MKRKKNVPTAFIITFELIILLVSIILIFNLTILNKKLTTKVDSRSNMIEAADKLRQSSDDLTHFARTFVVTADKTYYKQYFATLDIRNGKIPRPMHYESIYWDLSLDVRKVRHPDSQKLALKSIIKKLAFSEEELAQLTLSEKNSNDLVNLEVEAFEAMKNNNQQLAIKVLHSKEYYAAKHKIMNPIDRFILMTNERTSTEIDDVYKAIDFVYIYILLIILIFIVGNYLLYKYTHKILNAIAAEQRLNLQYEIEEQTKKIIIQTKILEITFEKSTDGILFLENGKFTRCNEAVVKMLDYESKEEFLNTHPSKLSPEFQPDGQESFSKANEMMAVAIKTGTNRFEWKHVKANGEEFWVEIVLTHISINDKDIIHVVWRDIENRKTLEAELELKVQKEILKNEQNMKENWIKDGIGGLNKELSLESDIVLTSKKSIDYLCNYVNAGVGALYIYDKKTKLLNQNASYAFVQREEISTIFALGEGVVGQVALQRSPIQLKNLKDNSFMIDTANSSQRPFNTYTFALVYQDELYGVVEVGSNEIFNEIKKEFFTQISQVMAIAISTAIQNQLVTELLDKYQEKKDFEQIGETI